MKQQLSAILSAKQERLAVLLAAGQAIKSAAAEIKVGERTAHTWLEVPHFRARVSELRGRMLDSALGRLSDAATRAVDTLVALLDEESGSLRLRASLGILDSLSRLRENVEFEARLVALENDHALRTENKGLAVRGVNGQSSQDWSEQD
jgi:hypothetical protein